jgi:hypothetical protein
MKPICVFLAVLIAVTSIRPQEWPGSDKPSNLLAKDKNEASKTLVESGGLIELDTKDAFFLVPKKPGSGPQNVPIWSLGRNEVPTWSFWKTELGAHQGLVVEIQVGEHEGKPVFLPLRVPEAKGQATIDDSVKFLTDVFAQNGTALDGIVSQRCFDGKQCVKSCKDSNGKEYCCRYECVKSKF